MVSNKHGRVGVKRQRPTRAELKKNMYEHGRREGRAQVSPMFEEEVQFTKSLLKLKSAGAIHEAIRLRHG